MLLIMLACNVCSLLSRLALPICLNYLYMIAVVDLVAHPDPRYPRPETAFALVNHLRQVFHLYIHVLWYVYMYVYCFVLHTLCGTCGVL